MHKYINNAGLKTSKNAALTQMLSPEKICVSAALLLVVFSFLLLNLSRRSKFKT